MPANDSHWTQLLEVVDDLRRAQGNALQLLGLGPDERSYRITASGTHWRVRDYADQEGGPTVLIVAAPIKRPYIWDIAPSASAIGYCLRHGVRVHLIEWLPPRTDDDDVELNDYADAIANAVAAVAERSDAGAKPFLMGHSLGGTLAAMYAALEPGRIQGLVLLASPLSFRRGVSPFGDSLVSVVPRWPCERGIVPGSFISQISTLASPETFLWSRFADAVFSLGDLRASEIHARIERWALDEVPLAAKMAAQILEWLYREDRFCRQTLTLRNKTVGPSRLAVPTLAVANTSDRIAPPDSVSEFLNAMPAQYGHLITYAGETGVCFQHVALLVGRAAQAMLWPEIVSWMKTGAAKRGR